MHYKVEKFLLSLDVLNILNNFLIFKKLKNGYLALCPFHSDKHPSFFFNSLKNRYYCFACHKKGNILDFVMEYNKLSFRDALLFLSKYSNLKIEYKNTNLKSFELLNVISNIYYDNLKKNFDLNKNLKFFILNRVIDFNCIDFFKIGYSENENIFLQNILFNFGYNKNLLLQSGVFYIKNSLCIDRFKNRIVFPIRSIDGEIIAFGGRSLNDFFKPKYINSSETSFFSKKLEFYGLYEAFNFFKSNTIIIVEGYMDVITLHRFGIKNVIAVLGSSFTKHHFNKIKSIYKNIIFCFDGDKAGKLASVRTAFSALSYMSYGNFIGFILLPEEFDPDSFLKAGNRSLFLNFIKKPVYLLDLIFNRIKSKISFFKDDKFKFFSVVLSLLDRISNLFIKKIIFFYLFKKRFNEDYYSFNFFKYYSLFLKKNITLGLKLSFFVIKNREFLFKFDRNYFLLSKNLDFLSDINLFFEVSILIYRYNLNNFNTINKFLFRKININEFNSINSFSIGKSYILSLFDKLYENKNYY